MAIEPAAGLRDILERRLGDAGAGNVSVARGFFDALPHRDGGFDMVVSCSAFAVDALDDPERCLATMESRCAPGGMVILVWPGDVPWLRARGFEHVVFEGPMLVEYASPEEAVTLARIFYPQRRGRGGREVLALRRLHHAGHQRAARSLLEAPRAALTACASRCWLRW